MRLHLTLLVLLALVLSATAALAQPADSDDYRQIVDITFPTDRRATFVDDYDHPRGGGRVHSATDLMGEKMWPVFAAVGGIVTFIPGVAPGESKPSYGYMIRIAGDDERTYSYVHLNDDTPGTSDASAGPKHAYAPGLERGSRVERGELIGWMGDSGNAKGGTPHLHFVIADDAVTDPYGNGIINPYNSLRDAEERGDHADGDRDPTPMASTQPIDRVSGATRIETAVALSAATFDEAEVVVVASAAAFQDAIVAGPLAAALDAPVLTTFGEELEDEVAEEIDRLGAETAIIVGPRTRVATQVERDIVAHTDVVPSELTRVTGPTDAETAARVAEAVRAITGSTDVLVALGSHEEEGRAWPDALTAGYHGAITGQPVLLVDHDGPPAVTLEALEGAGTATLVGGTAAISAASAELIGERVGTVRRLSGQDRFATAGEVADDLLATGLVDPSRLWVATGGNFADALAAAGAMAAAGELFVLIDGAGARGDGALTDWFASHAESIERARVIGGQSAVSDTAVARLQARIG